ncbi:GATA transcription factor 6-like [Dioscorea cayenensis subsp. rotundata]|uniref:GATA transcription factor 6-like n=1 Tax=Dioscorea cayennensis subsp. rotundata TaxID=55577 RepID=A0AB40B3A6_DIOCR|nr:GATA transcription factor 6-like [Dioscorea cayenensis subsp. rotundata]
MLHQTLTSFSFHHSSSSSSSSLQALVSPVKMEVVALKVSSREEMGEVVGEEVGVGLEKGSSLGDEFSIDDLLDFGAEEEADEAGVREDEEAEVFEPENSNSSSSSSLSLELPPLSEIALPAADVAELEWVSRIMDDSYSEFPPCSGVIPGVPVPKIEPKVEAVVPVKAKRSKRHRTAGWVRASSGQNPDPTSSSSTSSPVSSCSSSSSSPPCLIYDFKPPSLLLLDDEAPQSPKPKKRGRKPKSIVAATAGATGERRCSHCGVQKTPQWRAGPLGAKTLCNACGVRYKSGRLLPEYRPACSPTFVSHVHSNSHRKVLEMRRKKAEEEQRRHFLLTIPSSPLLPIYS